VPPRSSRYAPSRLTSTDLPPTAHLRWNSLVGDSMSCYHSFMNRKQTRILASIFAQPISGDIKWHDLEPLLKGLGAQMQERAGSRVAIHLHDQTAVLHRPHPSPSLDKGAVRDLRRFLLNAGVKP